MVFNFEEGWLNRSLKRNKTSVLWHCWLGVAKGIQRVKNWVMWCWHGYLSLARCKWSAYGPADATATPSSLASLISRLVVGLTFLVPAYVGCPGKEAIKRVSLTSFPLCDATTNTWVNGCCTLCACCPSPFALCWFHVVLKIGSRPSDHYFRSNCLCLSVCLSVCLCRVFLSRLRSDLDQTRTHVTCPGLVVSHRI